MAQQDENDPHRTQLPLSGFRILDLTVMAAGPIGTMMLGDIGADIIKIEPLRNGELARKMGTIYAGGESSVFLSQNRNKRSMRLDLKNENGRDVFLRMAAKCDAITENFRPGTMERLGIGYEAVRQINPKIIYASISAFGQTGPYANLPANDPVIQALTGVMAMTGSAREPARLGVALPDLMSAALLAFGISSALLHRERTGQGQQLDLSLLGATIFSTLPRDGETMRTGEAPERLGSGHPVYVPYRNYEGSDGSLFFLSCFNEKFWAALCDAINRPDLKDDPRSATNIDRSRNRSFVDGELERVFKTRSTDEWLRQFAEYDVPAARVQDLHYALRHDAQIAHNHTVVELKHPTAGIVEMLALPINFHGTPVRYERAAPRLGEHTMEILREFGFSEHDIERLAATKTIAGID